MRSTDAVAPAYPLGIALGMLVAVASACVERAPDARAAPALLAAAPASKQPSAQDDALAAGARVIGKHQCTRCHEIDGLPGVDRDHDCVSCHRMLKSLDIHGERYRQLGEKYGREVIDRYRSRIRHYLEIPSLTAIARRVRGDFIAEMLRAPFDQRPLLDESMLRTRVSAEERALLVRYFEAVAAREGDAARIDVALGTQPEAAVLGRGRALLSAKGCLTCHTLGGRDTGVDLQTLQAQSASRLAPDLTLTRARMRAERLLPWILEPSVLKPGTSMPAFVGTREEAELIAKFLWFGAEPLVAQAQAPLVSPKPLRREVGWAELKERVLGAVCVHCHMDDQERDRGAGNAGGLGHAGVGLSVRTYAGLVRGAVDEHGVRYSVLVPREPGREPPIVEAVLRRRAENVWDHRSAQQPAVAGPARLPDKLGMPLGLPALDDEQLALLRRWIELDCPGPTQATGRVGVTNGYLFPDGPAAKNRGCEQRESGRAPH